MSEPTIQVTRFHVEGCRDSWRHRITASWAADPVAGCQWVVTFRPTKGEQFPALFVHCKSFESAKAKALALAKKLLALGDCTECGHNHFGACEHVNKVENGWADRCLCDIGVDMEEFMNLRQGEESG